MFAMSHWRALQWFVYCPLYASMQQRASKKQRSRIIAALNIYNALFMVGMPYFGIIILTVIGMSIPELFLLLAILNCVIATYLIASDPIVVVRFLTWVLTHSMYRVTHKNLHHLPEKGGALLGV